MLDGNSLIPDGPQLGHDRSFLAVTDGRGGIVSL